MVSVLAALIAFLSSFAPTSHVRDFEVTCTAITDDVVDCRGH